MARTRSTVGDTASENWPIDLEELDALENLENWRLGDLHGEIRAAREHYGAELQECQDAIHDRRVRRDALRRKLASAHRNIGELDAVLAKDPGHILVHQAELNYSARAKQLNIMLYALRVATEAVEDEMAARIRTGGHTPFPGHVHLFNTATARRRRRKRVQLRKKEIRLLARGTR